jgi:hypothetical protein
MVMALQAILDISFQPDTSESINRVYFADPTKPAWRLFVARPNPNLIRLSLVAVRGFDGAPSDFNRARFQFTATTPPAAEANVRQEIEKIHSGDYAPLPTAQRATGGDSLPSGLTTMTIRNSTNYQLTIFFDGPVAKSLSLSPGESRDLDLVPGRFRVAGRAAALNVLPFYGEETYASSARYSMTFYVGR